MELRVLEYFLEIAEQGSITAAAKKLHLTQPTLSRQIKELEIELGQDLFVRHSHHVSLTPEGIVLRQKAQIICEMTEETKRELSKVKEKSVGDIYLGSAETARMHVLSSAIKAFEEDHPKSVVHFVSGNTEDLIERFDSGVLNFIIVASPFLTKKYQSIKLPGRERWVLYVKKDSELAQKEFVTRKDLKGIPLITSRQGLRKTLAYNSLAQWMGASLKDANVKATFNLPFLAGALAKEGVGSVITWEGLLPTGPTDDLVSIPLKPEVYDETYLCWQAGVKLSRAAATFLPYVQAQIKDETEREPDVS